MKVLEDRAVLIDSSAMVSKDDESSAPSPSPDPPRAAPNPPTDDPLFHPTLPVSQGPIRGAESRPDAGAYTPLQDEFFKTIFYFSGMGAVIGSALEEGVHVEERHRGRALDTDQLPPARQREQIHREEFPLVIACREKAQNIYGGLKNLHTLLDNVPTFSENREPTQYRPIIGLADVKPDVPIHGHDYFTAVHRANH